MDRFVLFPGWTAVTQSPQPQYVSQQIQLEDIRYHSPANTLHYSTHAPPNVYNQPGYQTVSSAQTPTTGFIQVSNGFGQQPAQVTTSSLMNGVPNVAPTINGNVEYLESSGRTDFVNGTPNYNHISQTVRIRQSLIRLWYDTANGVSVCSNIMGNRFFYCYNVFLLLSTVVGIGTRTVAIFPDHGFSE